MCTCGSSRASYHHVAYSTFFGSYPVPKGFSIYHPHCVGNFWVNFSELPVLHVITYWGIIHQFLSTVKQPKILLSQALFTMYDRYFLWLHVLWMDGKHIICCELFFCFILLIFLESYVYLLCLKSSKQYIWLWCIHGEGVSRMIDLG